MCATRPVFSAPGGHEMGAGMFDALGMLHLAALVLGASSLGASSVLRQEGTRTQPYVVRGK